MTSEDFKLARTTFASDLVKHISTLASGSILLLATFLGRVGKPSDTGALITGVVFLLCCIVFCSVHLYFFGINKAWVAEPDVSPRWSYRLLSTLIFVTFVLGMIFLGISVIRTL